MQKFSELCAWDYVLNFVMQPSRLLPLALATLMFASVSSSAFGYIDGGTGSMFIQAAISGLLAGVFLARGFFVNLFSRVRCKAAVHDSAPNGRA